MAKTWATKVQVRNNQLMAFDYPIEGYDQPSWRKPPSRAGYSGEVTAGTVRRIKQAVDVFLQLSEERKVWNRFLQKDIRFKANFLTLTVSQGRYVPAEEGHEALKVFLQHFKRPWRDGRYSEQIKSYLWKAELQGRGQLHYHLATNSYLDAWEIRRKWNDFQNTRGWLEEFKAKFGHSDPNSTDVHAVYKKADMGRYLSKYLAKGEFIDCSHMGFPALRTPVTLGGKVWGCSNDLKGKKRFTADMDEETWHNIINAHGNGDLKVKHMERCRFYDVKAPENLLSDEHFQSYYDWKTE